MHNIFVSFKARFENNASFRFKFLKLKKIKLIKTNFTT